VCNVRLIEFSPVGLRYSNTVLQTLLILLKKVPTSSSRLLVVATTSIASLLEDLQLSQVRDLISSEILFMTMLFLR
jgi:vesicle-fusing ATPase